MTTHSLYNNVFSNAPNQFHLLPSLLSSQTSYPFIGLCRSNPHNRLLNWQFDTGITQKPRLPLHPTTNQPICACGTIVDIVGDHIFKCKHICKIGVHNAIRDGFAHALARALSTAGFVPPNSTVDTEPYFTSHLILTPIRLTSPLTHIQPHHHSYLMDVPPTPSALISPSAHYLPWFLSILILKMFYKLSRPMPTHIYRNMNARNLAAPTKPTHPPPP